METGFSDGFSLPSSDLNVFVGPAGARKKLLRYPAHATLLRCLPGLEKGDTVILYQFVNAIKKGSKRVRTSEHELFFTCQSRTHGETHFLKERFSSHISLIQIQLRGYCSWKYRPQRTQIPKTKNINWPQAFWWASTGQEVLWTLKCQTPWIKEFASLFHRKSQWGATCRNMSLSRMNCSTCIRCSCLKMWTSRASNFQQ